MLTERQISTETPAVSEFCDHMHSVPPVPSTGKHRWRAAFTSRLAILLYAVLFHIVLFWALCGYIIFPAAPTINDTASFQATAIPVKPVTPPPPPPAGTTVPMSTALVPTPTPITSPTPTVKFTIPMPDVNGTEAASHLGLIHGTSQSGTGTTAAGTGVETATPTDNEDSGDVVNIVGLHISTGENLGFLLDNDGSMLHDGPQDTGGHLQSALHKWFFGTDITMTKGCRCWYIPRLPSADNEDILFPAYKLISEPANGKPITALVMASNWDEEENNTACQAFVEYLRQKQIKLFLLSIDGLPNQALIDYANESGGQLTITPRNRIDDGAINAFLNHSNFKTIQDTRKTMR